MDALSFNPKPHFFLKACILEFGHFGKKFVGIVVKLFSLQLGCHRIGEQGIEVVGEKCIATMEQQIEKKPHVEAGIKQHSFVEQQTETLYLVFVMSLVTDTKMRFIPLKNLSKVRIILQKAETN